MVETLKSLFSNIKLHILVHITGLRIVFGDRKLRVSISDIIDPRWPQRAVIPIQSTRSFYLMDRIMLNGSVKISSLYCIGTLVCVVEGSRYVFSLHTSCIKSHTSCVSVFAARLQNA